MAAGIYVKVAALNTYKYVGDYISALYIWARQDPIGPALGPHRSRNGMGLLGNPS